MSGGHFGYIQSRVNDAADKLKESNFGFESSTAEILSASETLVRVAAALLHRADWLISGDDGELNFKERLKDSLVNIALLRGVPSEDASEFLKRELDLILNNLGESNGHKTVRK